MNRPPSFQFYPRDWLDFKVQRMSFAAQGAYIKLLCYMWNDSKDQCSIADDNELIARGLGVSVDTWVRFRAEIQNEFDPILVVENASLVSSRLKAEAKKQRKYRRLQALKGTLSSSRRVNRGSTAVQPVHQPDANSSSSSSTSKKKPKNKASPSELPPVEAFELAQRLKDSILARDLKAKARLVEDLTGWAREFERLIRIDERSVETIRAVIDWCQRDRFWRSNILSAGKLREKFDALFAKMNENGGANPTGSGRASQIVLVDALVRTPEEQAQHDAEIESIRRRTRERDEAAAAAEEARIRALRNPTRREKLWLEARERTNRSA